MGKYKKTLSEVIDVLSLFRKNQVRYNLFKCEHIFEGVRKNVDILFPTINDYKRAGKLLTQHGFILYLPESVEEYKEMYVKVIGGKLTAIHLHREIAWHGVIALNKESIFNREQKVNSLITIPSAADALLIHIAHIAFENMKIREKEFKLLENYLSKLTKEDRQYIEQKVKQEKWRKMFHYIRSCYQKRLQPHKPTLFKGVLKKSMCSARTIFSLARKALAIFKRNVSWQRKGCLIALIGVNGTGKTTAVQETLKQYEKITSFFNDQKGVYLGWDPILPFTKVISRVLKKRNKKLVTPESQLKAKEKPSSFQEILFIYNYIEFSAKYYLKIHPLLRRNKLVITDRYFYDLFCQFHSARKSKVLPFLFRISPKPDFTFILDAPVSVIQKRKKEYNPLTAKKKTKERKVHPKAELEMQQQRYYKLHRQKNLQPIEILTTNQEIERNSQIIIEKTWKKIAKS